MIRQVRIEDADGICAVYNPYVTDTAITFEEEPVLPGTMALRIRDVTAGFPWLVACEDGVVKGYAYAALWRPRSAYRYSVETTVYVDRECMGKGIGTRLYTELLRRLPPLGVHSAMGVIALPNDASVALHEKLGFRKAGHFREVGLKFGRWIDVGCWQLILGDASPASEQ